MAQTIKVDGLADLERAMKSLSNDVAKKIAHSATSAAARLVRNAARSLVPVDTGALRGGIVVKRERATALTSEYMVTVSTREMRKYVAKSRAAIVELQGPIAPRVVNGKTYRAKKLLARKDEYVSYGDLFYGQFVEFGTVKQPPRPFLRPALANNIRPATDAMAQRLKTRIEKAGKR